MTAIGYCTNVHPCDSFNDVLKIVERPAASVRKRLGRETINAGLFLPAQAARWLAGKPKARAKLMEAMVEAGVVSTTANAFPFTAFHAPVVKEAVYRPSWCDVRRREHTLRVARVMAAIGPKDRQLSISTVPLGWHADFTDASAIEEAARELALFAWQVQAEAPPSADGRPRVRLGLEPEPFTALTTIHQTVQFFHDVLWVVGEDVISSEKGISREEARRILRSTIGVCLDACHAAVVFEDAAANFKRLQESQIPVVKVQLSNAPEVAGDKAVAALKPFVEAKYLHQTYVKNALGRVSGHVDLDVALASIASSPDPTTWKTSKVRSHFHLPLHFEGHGDLATTQGELKQLIHALAAATRADTFDGDIEVETYTWSVMPKGMGPQSIPIGVAEEIAWAEREFANAPK